MSSSETPTTFPLITAAWASATDRKKKTKRIRYFGNGRDIGARISIRAMPDIPARVFELAAISSLRPLTRAFISRFFRCVGASFAKSLIMSSKSHGRTRDLIEGAWERIGFGHKSPQLLGVGPTGIRSFTDSKFVAEHIGRQVCRERGWKWARFHGGVISQLLSARLQGGIRLLQYLFPAARTCDLAAALPGGRGIGVSLFRSNNNGWVSPC